MMTIVTAMPITIPPTPVTKSNSAGAEHDQRAHVPTSTVSFHNFKSQNFELSVSNPKNKYVAYLSVLSQNSNCQGLDRNNKHVILKTDRT